MKKSTINQETESPSSQNDFKKVLLSSLPYPAMYIRQKNRTIIAANKIALDLGAKIGEHCWREFGKSKFISKEDKKIASEYPNLVPEKFHIQCSFCRGDECISEFPTQNNHELQAFGKIWDTYWVKVSEDVFLHYLVDITERKEIEKALRESEMFLKQTQQIAMLGSYMLDLVSGNWVGSEVLGSILGNDANFSITSDSWESIIHPDWKKKIYYYFKHDVIKNRNKFDKEFQIIRQNDKSVRWVHGIGDMVFNDSNEPIKMIGTIQDITERKDEQSQVARHLRFTEALLKSIPIPVFVMDTNENYTSCNEAFSDFMGISSNKIKGMSIADLWTDEQGIIYHKHNLELLENQKFQTYESEIIDKNKQIRDVIFAKNVFYDEIGQVAGIVGTFVDITDRKVTEDALRKSEQTLLTVLDHFPGVVFWKDNQSNYLGCNQSFANGAGLKRPADIIGKTDFELPWGEVEGMNYRTDDKEVMENGEPKLHIIEKQHQADGKVIWFDTSKIPIRDFEGQVIGIIGVSSDISERMQAEEKLRQSEEKFRNLANYTEDWEFLINQHDNFLYCSPSCERITGYKATEFLQNPKLLSDIVHPDDQIIFHYHKQMEDEAIKMTQEVQYRIIRSDGSIRWIGHVCRPIFDESGIYTGVRGSNRDITKRKRTEELLKISEHKYKLLSENITDGIFICRNGDLEYVNKSMNHIFGYDDFEMEGLAFIQLITPDFRSDLKPFLISNQPANQIRIVEIECLRKDHSKVFVEAFLNYVANEQVIYGVVHDVTERKQIQKKNIVKAIIQTEEQERAYFSKELHDGLGPLLSTIKLYLQWTKRLESINKRNEVILKAEEIVEEALTTVKEISNKLSPHLLTNYGLSSAIHSFVKKLQETNAIKISFQSNATRRLEMETEVALYRAIIECINNTIKYAKAKNITILLNDTGKQIQIQYKDDGIGFDITKALSDKKGLGLFNLQNRIQTIGGKIRLFSEPGHGVDYQMVVNL